MVTPEYHGTVQYFCHGLVPTYKSEFQKSERQSADKLNLQVHDLSGSDLKLS